MLDVRELCGTQDWNASSINAEERAETVDIAVSHNSSSKPLSILKPSQQESVTCTPSSNSPVTPVTSMSTSSDSMNARSSRPPSVTAMTSLHKGMATVSHNNSPNPLSYQKSSQHEPVTTPRSNDRVSSMSASNDSLNARSSRPSSVTADTSLPADVAESTPICTGW
jgi:hypothetical protein